MLQDKKWEKIEKMERKRGEGSELRKKEKKGVKKRKITNRNKLEGRVGEEEEKRGAATPTPAEIKASQIAGGASSK